MIDKINIQEGDGNINNQVTIKFPEEDMGIISEIINEAIEKHEKILSEGNTSEKPELELELLDKIKFNFEGESDKKYIEELFYEFYEEIHIIEKLIDSKSTARQEILSKGIKSEYKRLLQEQNSVIEAIKNLFDYYVPIGKEKNPKYTNYTKGFILFFFDDCTIGEVKE